MVKVCEGCGNFSEEKAQTEIRLLGRGTVDLCMFVLRSNCSVDVRTPYVQAYLSSHIDAFSNGRRFGRSHRLLLR